MKTSSLVINNISALAEKINAPNRFLPTYDSPKGDGHPFVKIENDIYHIIYVERGVEFERKSFLELDDFLFYVFDDITYQMAIEYELRNRNHNQDSRKIMFQKQIELMSQISTDFGIRLRKKIADILKTAPYQDPPKFGI